MRGTLDTPAGGRIANPDTLSPVWLPSPELLRDSAVAQLARELDCADYEVLWRWSVADVGRFWRTTVAVLAAENVLRVIA
ncbi:MAG: hypothetical protein ACYDHH_14990 [Solirubrobacteraceae bacterium]